MWVPRASSPYKRLAAGWTVAALVTVLGFAAYERLRLGWSDAEGVTKVRAAVEAQFATAVQGLDAATTRAAAMAGSLERAALDQGVLRGLFQGLESLRQARPDISVTLYSPESTAVAWSGRPSDLPLARITGGAAFFVAPGPLGPRLVSVRPVLAPLPPGDSAARVSPPVKTGTVAAELLLPTSPPGTGASPEIVVWPAAGVSVRLNARYQGAGTKDLPGVFRLTAGEEIPLLEGRLQSSDIARARSQLRDRLFGVLLLLTGGASMLAAAPLLTWRRRTRSAPRFVVATLLATGGIAVGRGFAWMALPRLVPDSLSGGTPGLLFRSSIDFLLTAGAALLLVLILAESAIHARRAWRGMRRGPFESPGRTAGFVAAALGAGAAAIALFAGVQVLVRALTAMSAVDVLSFSLHPGIPDRLATEAGLVLIAAAAGWLAVTVMLAALIPFRLEPSWRARAVTAALWAAAPVLWWLWPLRGGAATSPAGAVLPLVFTILVASAWRRLARRYRHASQGARLILLFAGFVTPVLSWYPGVFIESDRAKQTLVATRLAPQATRQRDDLQERVRRTLAEIDAIPDLAELVRAGRPAASGPIPTDAAFHVWSRTDLSRFRVTSAIELYSPEGLASRFALKLPDYTSSQQRWEGSGCSWELFEEVSPFFSEERRLLYAGRGLCEQTPSGTRLLGAIAIYAMLDYSDLPLLAAQSPYLALLRGRPELDLEASQSRDVEYVVYGWSRRPLYASGAAWTLDDGTFRRVYASRQPFWTTLDAGGRLYAVHFANDRGGIYAIGYPTLTPVQHAVNLAELAALGGVSFVVLLLVSWLTALAGGYGGLRGRDLLREVRASFYRKLFLAFVAAAVIPVVTLAVVARAYLTARLLADVEEAAVRTTAVAQRVVEDYAQFLERGDRPVTTLDDDILVWIARLIDQDVNVFEGPELVATSERNLYASGVLTTRTTADVYRSIMLDRRAASVVSERVGWFDYLVASAPVKLGGREAILSVPLTLRQRAIEQEIDDLNRRILLAIVAFILGASALGYWMAERIADPVSRLQRATARIARGELTARVAVTSSDELRRLVEAFNSMASALQRQQGQLERTHRLEAWAEMARQVAHEIKNPLTPIQLSAEHLRRVHADRGTPLSPVLEGCVDSILTQVRLLRQIAGEFSSFASSPTPRPVDTDLAALVAEVIEPYRPGLDARLSLKVDLPADLPTLHVDRTLIGRALTNVVDNGLHAMPGAGVLTVTAARSAEPPGVSLTVADTGVGMDAAAVERIFEPYFSTKATGTGLGLTIAKRNVELHGGTVSVVSEVGRGTSVTLWLPLDPPPPAAEH
jgi:signal transduction histidine kinase